MTDNSVGCYGCEIERMEGTDPNALCGWCLLAEERKAEQDLLAKLKVECGYQDGGEAHGCVPCLRCGGWREPGKKCAVVRCEGTSLFEQARALKQAIMEARDAGAKMECRCAGQHLNGHYEGGPCDFCPCPSPNPRSAPCVRCNDTNYIMVGQTLPPVRVPCPACKEQKR